MNKINRKSLECYLLKRYINCLSPQRKILLHYDRYICPIFLQTLPCVKQLRNQQKVDTVWNYQVKSYKPPGIDFFNSFIVTNWRFRVSKLLVLVKVPTPIITSGTQLIESFKNRMYNGMPSFVRKISFIQAYRGRVKKKSRRGCSCFISHLPMHKRNDNVTRHNQ